MRIQDNGHGRRDLEGHAPISHDRNGWDLTGNGFTIVLHGQWCDHLIEDGPADFAVFPDLQSATVSRGRDRGVLPTFPGRATRSVKRFFLEPSGQKYGSVRTCTT